MGAAIFNYTPTWVDDEPGLPTNVTFNGRPVVLIDPEDPAAVERLAARIRLNGGGHPYATLSAEQCRTEVKALQAALRMYTTAPKPDEPQGLGAVVEDASGTKWLRHDSVPIRRCWLNTDDCDVQYRAYDEITAVRVLSEGVTP